MISVIYVLQTGRDYLMYLLLGLLLLRSSNFLKLKPSISLLQYCLIICTIVFQSHRLQIPYYHPLNVWDNQGETMMDIMF